jgi:hypothetical protein
MAATILKAMRFPALVTSVEIDPANQSGTARNAKVSGVARKNGGVSFQQLDEALQFFPAEAEGILRWSSVRKDLNGYTLKVTGLKDGKYDVRLAGKTVATYTARELAGGVNLAAAALKAGPVAGQVKRVVDAVNKRNDYFATQVFRVMRPQLPRLNYLGPPWPAPNRISGQIASRGAGDRPGDLPNRGRPGAVVPPCTSTAGGRSALVPVSGPGPGAVTGRHSS